MTRLTGTLRIVCGLAVIGLAIALGWLHRSPWVLVPLSLAFTVLYVAGKWSVWRAALRRGGLGRTLAQLLATWPVQLVVAGLFYLVGFGLGALLTDRATAPGVTGADLAWIAAVGVSILLVTVWIERTEDHAAPAPLAPDSDPGTLLGHGRGGAARDELAHGQAGQEGTGESGDDGERLDLRPVTPATFFGGPHHMHVTYGGADGPTVDDDASRGRGPAEIAEAEARLGVRLPDGLKRLYAIQNGGQTNGTMFVPLVADPRPVAAHWRETFACGYDHLNPIERLETVHEYYLNWIDPDDPEEAETIPDSAGRMIVLAARYEDVTLLDYTKGDEPEVAQIDFEAADATRHARFGSFDAFFAALRREA